MPDAFTTRVLNVNTGSAETVVDLTRDCEAFLREAAAGRDGLLNVFVPHATAGVAIIETGAGSDDDLLAALHSLLPADDRWQHRHGGPGTAVTAYSPPPSSRPRDASGVGGRLELGTWQSVCLVDTDGQSCAKGAIELARGLSLLQACMDQAAAAPVGDGGTVVLPSAPGMPSSVSASFLSGNGKAWPVVARAGNEPPMPTWPARRLRGLRIPSRAPR